MSKLDYFQTHIALIFNKNIALFCFGHGLNIVLWQRIKKAEKSRLYLATWLSLFNTRRVERDLCCNTSVIPPPPHRSPFSFPAREYTRRGHVFFPVVFFGSSTPLHLGDRQVLLKFNFQYIQTNLRWGAEPRLELGPYRNPVELDVRCTLGLLHLSELSFFLLCYSELY